MEWGLSSSHPPAVPPNDAHLPRDGSAAPCQSVPSTQAARVVYLHLMLTPQSEAIAQQCVKAPFLLSQSAVMCHCIIASYWLQAPSVSMEQSYALEHHTHSQQCSWLPLCLGGEWTTILVSCSHTCMHLLEFEVTSSVDSRTMIYIYIYIYTHTIPKVLCTVWKI